MKYLSLKTKRKKKKKTLLFFSFFGTNEQNFVYINIISTREFITQDKS